MSEKNDKFKSSKTAEYTTPDWVFDPLNAVFKFTLDPCATKQNTKCLKFYTVKEDGLKQSWKGERVFMNPPYGHIYPKWVDYALEQSRQPKTMVLCLIAGRHDTVCFQDVVVPECDAWVDVRGRIGFSGKVNPKTGKIDPALFPSAMVILNGGRKMTAKQIDGLRHFGNTFVRTKPGAQQFDVYLGTRKGKRRGK